MDMSETSPVLSRTDEKKKEENADEKVTFLQKLQGILATLLAVAMTVASCVSVQILERAVPDFELNTMRCISALLQTSIGMMYNKQKPAMPRDELPWACGFVIAIFLDGVSRYVAVTFAPLASVQALETTSGIISGIILYAFFLDDKVTVKNIILSTICILGLILIIQPEFIFDHKSSSAQNGSDFNQSQVVVTGNSSPAENVTTSAPSGAETFDGLKLLYLGYILACVTGTSCSFSYLAVKRRPYLNENRFQLLFWTFLFGTILSAIIMAIFEDLVLPTGFVEVFYIIIHCVAYFWIWYPVVYANKYISANTINIIYSTTIVGMLIFQYTVLSSILPGNRNWMEVVGVVFVLFGSSLESICEMYKSK